jgi:hypothetical protein
MPSNGQTVQLSFKKPVSATAVGSAAEAIASGFDAVYEQRSLELAKQQQHKYMAQEGEDADDDAMDIDGEGQGGVSDGTGTMTGNTKPSVVSGFNAPMLVALPPSAILVGQNFTYKIVNIDDIESYTPLRCGKLLNKQHIAIPPATMQLFASNSTTNSGVNSVSSLGGAVLPLLAVYPYLYDIFHDMDTLSFGISGDGKDTRIDITYHYASVGQPIKLDNDAMDDESAVGFQAIYTCSDKDFITIGNVFRVSYYNPTGERNRFHSLVIEWNANPFVDWAAEAAVCSMTYALSIENALRVTSSIDREGRQLPVLQPQHPSPPSSSQYTPTNNSSTATGDNIGIPTSGHNDDIIDRMRAGVIDPSIASDLASITGNAAFKARLSRIRDLFIASYCSNAAAAPTKAGSKKRTANTVKELDLSSKSSWFRSVQLDASGKRLIIQSAEFEDPRNPAKTSTQGPAEAYLFIEWARNQKQGSCKACNHATECSHMHHAVVQCDHDELRHQVMYALQHLESDATAQ